MGWCECCFFFSSRRRHTRFDCDWSSDVCSSDLALNRAGKKTTTSRTLRAKTTIRHTRKVTRSEEHTSELQSQSNLVCRLLLEKKKKNKKVFNVHDHHCDTSDNHNNNTGHTDETS